MQVIIDYRRVKIVIRLICSDLDFLFYLYLTYTPFENDYYLPINTFLPLEKFAQLFLLQLVISVNTPYFANC